MLLYFKGCTANEKLNSISESTRKLLEIANVDFVEMDNESCCGSVLLRTGFREDAIIQMKKTLDNLNTNLDKLCANKIITSCAGCYKTLKYDYSDILDSNLEVIHISQLLDELFKEGKLSYDLGDCSKNVTYHDPCHLGRHSGEYDAPRNVISNLANLVEMKNIKEQASCCGSGGGVKSAYGDLAKSIAKLRIEEAEDTSAEIIVSACPFCKLNLKENSDKLDVLDLSEFVLDNIKERNLDYINKESTNLKNDN